MAMLRKFTQKCFTAKKVATTPDRKRTTIAKCLL